MMRWLAAALVLALALGQQPTGPFRQPSNNPATLPPNAITRGPAFNPGRAAIINPAGSIDGANGVANYCVHVDGSTGQCVASSINDVPGLPPALNARPTAGPGYAPSRTAVIDPNGMLEAAAGNLSDCVHVDGSSGACGSAGGGATGSSVGATMAGQLGDFGVALANSTTLTIGAGCTLTTPCNAQIGSAVYSYSTGGSAVIVHGTGNAYIYIAANGVLTVGYNLAPDGSGQTGLTCDAHCTVVSGITTFPTTGIPLALWHATNGTWDAAGGDFRSFVSTSSITTGLGLMSVTSGGQTTIAIDTTAANPWGSIGGSATTLVSHTEYGLGVCGAGSPIQGGAYSNDGSWNDQCNNVPTVGGSGHVFLLRSNNTGDTLSVPIVMPSGVSAITAHVKGFPGSDSSSTLTMQALVGCIANGAAFNSGSQTGGATVSVSATVSNQMTNFDLTAPVVCAAGDLMMLQIYRGGSYTGQPYFWMDFAVDITRTLP